MNRLRHAYHEMVPGLERYFVTSRFDDIESVLSFYGPAAASPLRGMLHGFTTTPGMIGVICSAVAGALAAVIGLLLTHAAETAAISAAGVFLVAFVLISGVMGMRVRRSMRDLRSMFPRTDWTNE